MQHWCNRPVSSRTFQSPPRTTYRDSLHRSSSAENHWNHCFFIANKYAKIKHANLAGTPILWPATSQKCKMQDKLSWSPTHLFEHGGGQLRGFLCLCILSHTKDVKADVGKKADVPESNSDSLTNISGQIQIYSNKSGDHKISADQSIIYWDQKDKKYTFFWNKGSLKWVVGWGGVAHCCAIFLCRLGCEI